MIKIGMQMVTLSSVFSFYVVLIKIFLYKYKDGDYPDIEGDNFLLRMM